MDISQIETIYEDVVDFMKVNHFARPESRLKKSYQRLLYMRGKSELFKILSWMYLNEYDLYANTTCGKPLETLKEQWLNLFDIPYTTQNTNAHLQSFGIDGFKVVSNFFKKKNITIVTHFPSKLPVPEIFKLKQSCLIDTPNMENSLKVDKLSITPFKHDLFLIEFDDSTHISNLNNVITYICRDYTLESTNAPLTVDDLKISLDYLHAYNPIELYKAILYMEKERINLWLLNDKNSSKRIDLLKMLIPNEKELVSKLTLAGSLGLTELDTACLLAGNKHELGYTTLDLPELL